MSFTLSTLRTAIRDYTEVDDTVLSDSIINTIVKNAESRIFRSVDSDDTKFYAVSLQNVRTDRDETAVPQLLDIDAFETGSSGSSTITVTERTHGRSSSDTVRFRSVDSFDGITKANLENSSGYSITKVDADTYTFSVSTDTATTGNIRGGGGRATAGPVTIEN